MSRSAVFALLCWLTVAGARAAEAPPPAGESSPARDLAERALAAYHRGEAREEGSAGAYDDGVRLAERAIAANPKYADAYYALFLNLARRTERSGVAAQARSVGRLRELLRKTIELDPRHADAWEAQGEMLLGLPWLLGGSKREAEASLRKAEEVDPSWPKPPLRLAELYRKNGDVARARAEALRARDLARRNEDGRKYLAEAEALLAAIPERDEQR